MSELNDSAMKSQDEFSELVNTLRNDFRRVFPFLRPNEDDCFFIQQNDDKTSGKVWIEFINQRKERRFHSKITLVIEGNRAVRRVYEETEIEEPLMNTALFSHC